MKYAFPRICAWAIFSSAIFFGGCGGKSDQAAGEQPPNVQRMEMPAAAAPQSGGGPAPDGESVAGEFDGKRFEAALITQCPATPGYALGFNATTEDYVSNAAGKGLRIGGGFEKEQGKLSANYLGRAWKAGEGSDGELDFTMTSARSADGKRQFVTVHATGTFVDEAGASVPFDVIATCEPGGT